MLNATMSTFKAQEEIALEVLAKTGRFIVYKVTRAGTTITLVLVALEQGMKVVVFVPTKKLAAEIISEISTLFRKPLRVAYLGPNSEICKKLDPNLRMRFQFKENCSKCELLGNLSECPFQNLLLKRSHKIPMPSQEIWCQGCAQARRNVIRESVSHQHCRIPLLLSFEKFLL